MVRCVADDSVPIALKSFSADHPSGSTGSGSWTCIAAIMLVLEFSIREGVGLKQRLEIYQIQCAKPFWTMHTQPKHLEQPSIDNMEREQ